MGQAVSGMQIGAKVGEALGLPKRTRLIEITIGMHEAVTVKCEYLPDAEGVERAIAVLQEYELVKKGDEAVKAADFAALKSQAEYLRGAMAAPVVEDKRPIQATERKSVRESDRTF